VRSRRDDVDQLLTSGRFRRVAPPEGASPRAVYFDVSRRVLRVDGGLPARAERMLDVLRDGHGHSRRDIVAAGEMSTTRVDKCRLCGSSFEQERRRGRPRALCPACSPEDVKAKKRAYYQREDVKAKQRAYYQREDVKAKQRAYRQREDVKAKKRAYYQREDVKAKQRAYRQREDVKAKQRA